MIEENEQLTENNQDEIEENQNFEKELKSLQ